MLYSVLIYGDENVFERLPVDGREASLERHRTFRRVQGDGGRLGPCARLLKTSTAVTVRHDGRAPVVLDGPFAETKEQLLGFYLVDFASLEEAIEAVKALPIELSAVEIRPVGWVGGGPVPSTPS